MMVASEGQLTVLREVTRLLKNTITGDWLLSRVRTFEHLEKGPRFLVTGAAPHLAQAFPEGLDVLRDSHLLPSNAPITEAAAALSDSDVWVWVMAATRMFPRDHSELLQIAERAGIPIWAIATGMQRLDDLESFLQVSIPSYLARLPPDSEIFRIDPQDSDLHRKAMERAIGY